MGAFPPDNPRNPRVSRGPWAQRPTFSSPPPPMNPGAAQRLPAAPPAEATERVPAPSIGRREYPREHPRERDVAEMETQYATPAAPRRPTIRPQPTTRDLADEPTKRLRTTAAPPQAPRKRPLRLTAVLLALGLILVGARAGFASAAFMDPGGSIPGWSNLPPTHCALCGVQITSGPQTHTLTATEYATLLAGHMSLDDKLGQLLMVQFVGQDATPDAIQMVNAQGAGAILFFGLNIRTANQVRAMNAQLQNVASVPLILAVDQEGGAVNRFKDIPSVGSLPAASDLTGTQQAQQRGAQDSVYLHDFGFNLNLAPVADVGTANPQLYTRTFGADPVRVGDMAGAYLAGLQASGTVTACVKHFPGLGATDTDPHRGLPVLNRSRATWESTDLAPYRNILSTQDVRAIMVSHELIPAVDSDYPTSLSPAIIDGALRGELGYQGVVITDDLFNMGAVNARWSGPEASVLAIKAGADLLIGPSSPLLVKQTKDAFKQALANGSLSQDRINLSVQRVLALKIKMGLIPLPQQPVSDATPSPTGAPPARLPTATTTR